ncbi:MAG TPA: hypothetical protein VLA00_06155 [Xanthobacteraceae bacterium]|nr:hypothetical protein [Xanthobacteraceae bacterium]
MVIDRRTFVLGAGVAAAAPALGIAPPAAPTAAAGIALGAATPVFVIDGWADRDGAGPDNQLWLKVGSSWRTAWR